MCARVCECERERGDERSWGLILVNTRDQARLGVMAIDPGNTELHLAAHSFIHSFIETRSFYVVQAGLELCN